MAREAEMQETDAGGRDGDLSGLISRDDSGSTPEPATTPPGFRRKVTNRGANGGTSPLPPGMNWLPHEGHRARLRRHRQAWSQYEKLAARDSYAKVTRERLLDWVASLPVSEEQAEIVAMGLALRARCHAEESGTTWTTALNRALNELEEAEDKRRASLADTKGVVI